MAHGVAIAFSIKAISRNEIFRGEVLKKGEKV